MPTQEEINNGMTLDEILGSDAPADVFGSLKSKVLDELDASLNDRVPGGISDLVNKLLAGDGDPAIVADALAAELTKFKTAIDEQIETDLTIQTDLKTERAAIDLTTQILPQNVLQPELLDIVTTDSFKEVVNSFVDPTEEDEDEE